MRNKVQTAAGKFLLVEKNGDYRAPGKTPPGCPAEPSPRRAALDPHDSFNRFSGGVVAEDVIQLQNLAESFRSLACLREREVIERQVRAARQLHASGRAPERSDGGVGFVKQLTLEISPFPLDRDESFGLASAEGEMARQIANSKGTSFRRSASSSPGAALGLKPRSTSDQEVHFGTAVVLDAARFLFVRPGLARGVPERLLSRLSRGIWNRSVLQRVERYEFQTLPPGGSRLDAVDRIDFVSRTPPGVGNDPNIRSAVD